MDALRWVFDTIAGVIQAAIGVLAQFILMASTSMVDMTEAEAEAIATAALGLVVFAWLGRRTIWGKGLGVFRPMTITLQTTKTPWQVMMGDLRSCLVTALAVLVFVVFVLSILFEG